MKQVKILEIQLSNINELFDVIRNTIELHKNVQIFISNTLFKRFLQHNKNSIIWEELVLNNFHYCDKIEKAFIFSIMTSNTPKIFQIHFVENCLDYIQITFFANQGLLYRHYLSGMDVIIIINSD